MKLKLAVIEICWGIWSGKRPVRNYVFSLNNLGLLAGFVCSINCYIILAKWWRKILTSFSYWQGVYLNSVHKGTVLFAWVELILSWDAALWKLRSGLIHWIRISSPQNRWMWKMHAEKWLYFGWCSIHKSILPRDVLLYPIISAYCLMASAEFQPTSLLLNLLIHI